MGQECLRPPVVRAHARRDGSRFSGRVGEARYLILTTPRHGEFYRAITLASREGDLPPVDPSVEGSLIKQAAQEYGVEFVGPLPDSV